LLTPMLVQVKGKGKTRIFLCNNCKAKLEKNFRKP